MGTEQVRFYSHGAALAGTLMLPDGASEAHPVPAVAQGPGWLGLRDAKLYQPYHQGLLAAGMGVLVFDYRGFGDSEGRPRQLMTVRRQLADWQRCAPSCAGSSSSIRLSKFLTIPASVRSRAAWRLTSTAKPRSRH